MCLSSARPLSLTPSFYARWHTQCTTLLLSARFFFPLCHAARLSSRREFLLAFSSAVRRTGAPAASLGGLLPSLGGEGWGMPGPLGLFNNNMGGLRAHVEEHAAFVNAVCFVPGYAAKDLHVTIDPAADILMVTGKHGRGARQESATAFFELPHMELGKAEVHLDKGVLVRPALMRPPPLLPTPRSPRAPPFAPHRAVDSRASTCRALPPPPRACARSRLWRAQQRTPWRGPQPPRRTQRSTPRPAPRAAPSPA